MDIFYKEESVLRNQINVKSSMKTIIVEHVVIYMDKRIYIQYMVNLKMVFVQIYQKISLIFLIKYQINNKYINVDISLIILIQRLKRLILILYLMVLIYVNNVKMVII